MLWNDHNFLSGKHAYLSPSRYAWLNYSPEKLIGSYENHKRIGLGTKYHKLAEMCIELAQRLPDNGAPLNSFVNDAIRFKMDPERVLYYSSRCFGTADAISYRDGILRIHDLKTGVSPGSIQQVIVYAAIFCLEYDVAPEEFILRIYHEQEVTEYRPAYEAIQRIMRKVIDADKLLKEIDENDVH